MWPSRRGARRRTRWTSSGAAPTASGRLTSCGVTLRRLLRRAACDQTVFIQQGGKNKQRGHLRLAQPVRRKGDARVRSRRGRAAEAQARRARSGTWRPAFEAADRHDSSWADSGASRATQAYGADGGADRSRDAGRRRPRRRAIQWHEDARSDRAACKRQALRKTAEERAGRLTCALFVRVALATSRDAHPRRRHYGNLPEFINVPGQSNIDAGRPGMLLATQERCKRHSTEHSHASAVRSAVLIGAARPADR